MKYSAYKVGDCVNGTGFRNVLWATRCSHGCNGCFNIKSWKGGGIEVDEVFINRCIKDLRKPFIKGFTFSGGDCLHKANLQTLKQMLVSFKQTLPEKDIWLYTGYTYSQLLQDPLRKPLLEYIDVLVDGKYEKDLEPAPFRGSSNQEIINVKESLAKDKKVLYSLVQDN